MVKEKLATRDQQGQIGILVLDVDDFKHVNDTKGMSSAIGCWSP